MKKTALFTLLTSFIDYDRVLSLLVTIIDCISCTCNQHCMVIANLLHKINLNLNCNSERSLSAECRAKFNNQIIDTSWASPGQSDTPSLECILSQCYSIKSWLDIRSDHIAVVHCSTGRSRSGILIACLLKYIRAFDRAADAFDFFCRTR